MERCLDHKAARSLRCAGAEVQRHGLVLGDHIRRVYKLQCAAVSGFYVRMHLYAQQSAVKNALSTPVHALHLLVHAPDDTAYYQYDQYSYTCIHVHIPYYQYMYNHMLNAATC